MKIVSIAVFVGITIVPGLANAADSAQWACGKAPAKILFRAHFEDATSGTRRKLTLEIGKSEKGAEIVQIKANGACEASCAIRRFDPASGIASQSMDLDCRSSKLAHLITPATVLWTEPRGQSGPSLRFGTWLKGYSVAPLRVEIDRYWPKPEIQLARAGK